jgi:hypothetical protein
MPKRYPPSNEHYRLLALFKEQRRNAKKRGIVFVLSFAEWLLVWGDGITQRGCKKGQLVMARKGDSGPYALGNVYITTCGQNVSEGQHRSLARGRARGLDGRWV